MEIVIKIPEKVYKALAHTEFDANLVVNEMRKSIANGTPLSKGHGRLIDVNDLLDRIGLEDNDTNREENVGEIITLEDFDYTPTIIEADKDGGTEWINQYLSK